MNWPQLIGLLAGGAASIILFVPGILIALLAIDIRMIYLVPLFIAALLGFLVPILVTFASPTNDIPIHPGRPGP